MTSTLTQLIPSSAWSVLRAPTWADLGDDTHEAIEDQPEQPHSDPPSVVFTQQWGWEASPYFQPN